MQGEEETEGEREEREEEEEEEEEEESLATLAQVFAPLRWELVPVSGVGGWLGVALELLLQSSLGFAGKR